MIEEDIIQAWFDVLDGNVTVAGYTFPVYRTDAAISDRSHHIFLRAESAHPEWNKAGFFRTFVLIVEVFTTFSVIINDKLVNDADQIIKSLVFNSPGSNNLGVTGLIKLDYGSPTWLPFDNGSRRILRKITRFIHQVAAEQP